MTTTATAQAPKRGTWKQTHGENSAMIWFGTGKVPAETGVPALLGTQEGRLVALTPAGKPVFHGGMNTRFWAIPDTDAPANQPEPVQVPQQRQPVASDEGCQCQQESCGSCNNGGQLDDDGNALEGGPIVVTADAKAIQRAARPGRNAKLHDCLCGCKGQVKGMYKQGHDARHAADVAAKAIAAGYVVDLTKALAELPTEALRVKAAAIVRKVVK